MAGGLQRRYGTTSLHFITCSCYRRQPLLEDDRIKRLFLSVFDETRKKYGFYVVGYVLMPEHFHLLISDPGKGDPGTALQILKQRVSHEALKIIPPTLSQKKGKNGAPTSPPGSNHAEHQFWQRRFYDFNVWSRPKQIEKLKYMHRNPVRRGLVTRPEDWPWSSFRHYATGDIGPVEIESDWTGLRREREVRVMLHP